MVKQIILTLYLVGIHVLAALFVYDRVRIKPTAQRADETSLVGDSASVRPSTSSNGPVQTTPHASHPAAAVAGLMIPVAGVRRDALMDTYTQSREGGARVHNAIDIPAAEGTPVVATADGPIAKFFDSQAGGITIYQWSADSQYVYYYAHLQRRADGVREGGFVRRGTVIGYVGATGNAGPQNYHLHFAVSIPTTPGRHWEGTPVNPYPLLREGLEAPVVRE